MIHTSFMFSRFQLYYLGTILLANYNATAPVSLLLCKTQKHIFNFIWLDNVTLIIPLVLIHLLLSYYVTITAALSSQKERKYESR